MEDQKPSFVEWFQVEYDITKCDLYKNIEFLKSALRYELDKKPVPCFDRKDFIDTLKRIKMLSNICKNLYIQLKNAGYPPSGKPLEDIYMT